MISHSHLSPGRYLPWLLCLPLLFLGCTQNSSEYKSAVVMRVNSSELTAEEFSDQLLRRLMSFNILSAKDSAVVAQAKNSVVQNFIVRVITEEWAKSHSLFVRKELIDEEISRIKKSYPNEIIFRKSLADNKLSFDTWQEEIKHTLRERLVLEELRKRISPPTTVQMRSYYEENKKIYQVPNSVRLRQIVVDSESVAQNILRLLSQGRSMSDLAKQYSLGSEASIGGDVGWIEKGFFGAFDGAFKMSIGQRSPVIKSSSGYLVYQVTDKRSAKTLPFEVVKAQVERALIEKQEQVIYSTWLEEQVLKAKVFKNDELIQHIQVFTKGN